MIDDALFEARGVTIPHLPLARFGCDLHAAGIDFGRLDLLATEAARSPDDLRFSIRHVRITTVYIAKAPHNIAGLFERQIFSAQEFRCDFQARIELAILARRTYRAKIHLDRDARPVRCNLWLWCCQLISQTSQFSPAKMARAFSRISASESSAIRVAADALAGSLRRPSASKASLPKQPPHRIILHRHVQIRRRDRYVRMTNRIANFCQSPAASQRVADERVPAMMDRERFQTLGTEYATSRAVSLPQRVPRERLVVVQRCNELIAVFTSAITLPRT